MTFYDRFKEHKREYSRSQERQHIAESDHVMVYTEFSVPACITEEIYQRS